MKPNIRLDQISNMAQHRELSIKCQILGHNNLLDKTSGIYPEKTSGIYPEDSAASREIEIPWYMITWG